MPDPSPAAAAVPRATGSRAVLSLRGLLRAAAWLLAAAWTVVLTVWLTLHWGILPRIDDWRGSVERHASAALGVPVQIGRIAVHSSGWVPALELRDVALLARETREPALTLPRVVATLSPRSLLALEPRFEQLFVDAPALDVRRDPLGRIVVAGLPLGEGSGAAGADDAADWFFRQREFVVRGGRIRWTDEMRLAPPLVLDAVDIVVRNGLRRHDFRIAATPDAAWGERFSVVGRFTQPLLARGGDWRRWNGSVYVELPRADLRELRHHVGLPFELSEGDGALRAWIDFADTRPRAVTADVALRAVALRLAPQVEPLVVQQLEGRVVAERDADGALLAVRRLGFVTGDGIRWPEGSATLRLRQREGQPVEGGEFDADRLDLGVMAQVAGRLPVGDAVRRLLVELQPRGQMQAMHARWDGPVDAPTRYQVKGHLGALALAALPAADGHSLGRPGLTNADVQISASEAGGDARLTIAAGAVTLPGVFERSEVPLERLAATLRWTVEPQAGGAPPRVRVEARDVQFANADAEGAFDGAWSTGAGDGFGAALRYPGRLELDGRVGRARAIAVPRYLPLAIGETRDYLARAIVGGSVAGASFRVRGDLWDFPFFEPAPKGAPTGELRIALRAEDLVFAYVPNVPASAGEPAWTSPWPPLTQLSGELVIDRNTLEIRDAKARVHGVDLTSVRGGIAAMRPAPVLRLEGAGRGPLAEMLRFVDRTPVAEWTSRALHEASATGSADLRLAIELPLGDLDASSVRGSVTLAGNDVRIASGQPLLGAARGRVDFTQRGFAIVGASAQLLGGEAAFDGGTQPDGSVRVQGRGHASADALRRQTEWPFVAQVASALRGQAAYALDLRLAGGGRPQFTLTSDLAGIAADLPAPLAKAADTTLPLTVATSQPPDEQAAGRPTRELLRVDIGNVVQAHWLREAGAQADRVLRGGIGVFAPAPAPASGVAATAELPLLHVDEWRAAIARVTGTAPDAVPAHGDTGYVPARIALRTRELVVASRRLAAVTAGLSLADGAWRATLDAESLAGFVEWRPQAAGGAGRVHARLARLALPKGEEEQVDPLLDADPADVPALDIVVDDFELRGKKLGRLEIEAVNRESPREWQLSKLNLTLPEARLAASGSWAPTVTPNPLAGAPAPRRRAVLDFKLAVADSGALLARLGTPQAMRGGKGELAGSVAWLGSPLLPDYASMSGTIGVAIEAGQFLKADPGAARLLGVLSLQSLPRRLVLDFRDVFQEGFPFDAITGDVVVDQGIARTNNLRMRGVQAAVLMEGAADLARETTDLRVVVVPQIDAGTASLAYAAINPAIGIGTFLAQLLLRRPLAAANTREFHVSGPWADPKVERIEARRPDDAAAAAAGSGGEAAAPPAPGGVTQ